MNKFLAVALIGGAWMLSASTAHAQTTPQEESTAHVISNQDIDLLRKDLRSRRKQLIAANLRLNDIEAAKFWPVYDQYIAELIAINDRKFGLIQEYADRKSTRLNSSHRSLSRMPSSA